jgi:hypothetical protein
MLQWPLAMEWRVQPLQWQAQLLPLQLPWQFSLQLQLGQQWPLRSEQKKPSPLELLLLWPWALQWPSQ